LLPQTKISMSKTPWQCGQYSTNLQTHRSFICSCQFRHTDEYTLLLSSMVNSWPPKRWQIISIATQNHLLCHCKARFKLGEQEPFGDDEGENHADCYVNMYHDNSMVTLSIPYFSLLTMVPRRADLTFSGMPAFNNKHSNKIISSSIRLPLMISTVCTVTKEWQSNLGFDPNLSR
jgi:hypothetical protein